MIVRFGVSYSGATGALIIVLVQGVNKLKVFKDYIPLNYKLYQLSMQVWASFLLCNEIQTYLIHGEEYMADEIGYDGSQCDRCRVIVYVILLVFLLYIV